MHRFNSSTSIFSKRDDAANEFNNGYKRYLESKLVYAGLSELINSFSKIDSNSISSTNQQARLEEKISDNYWKAALLADLEDNKGVKLLSVTGRSDGEIRIEEDIRPEKLSEEDKRYIVDKLEELFEKKLNCVEKFLNANETEKHSLMGSLNESCNERVHVDIDQLMDDFNGLKQSIATLDDEIEHLSDEMCVKLDHCFLISTQIVKTLQILLGEFRLGFYAQENVTSCQSQLHKCEMMLGKIFLVKNEIIADMYTPEKLKALKMIKSQLKAETAIAMERQSQLKMTLDMFKSFGKEFEELLSEYLALRKELEKKNWTWNKLKEDMI